MSALGGIHPHILPNEPDGTLDLGAIESAIRGENVHFPRTRLIALENTHNRCYGAPLTPAYIDEVAALGRRYGLKIHLDGARIFNAVVALGIDVKKFTSHVDSLSFCLSKGLSAPVGSMVCGSRGFISEARRTRKVLGGGMRQAGIIAAAGEIALKEMVDRLAEDHSHARRLAEGMVQIPGLSIDVERVKTNIIYFDLHPDPGRAGDFAARLAMKGIKALRTGPYRFRMVTHHGILAEDIDHTLKVLREVMNE
jgi:threonine aldolase